MKQLIPSLFLTIFISVTISCSKTDDISEKEIPQTVTDIDGNVYKTVIIGDQVWMAENLRTTRLNDGIMIDFKPEIWTGSTAGYCWPNGDEINKVPYGAFYNWYAVKSGKLAPDGWRVPSFDDFERLKSTLGGNQIAGGRMKCRIEGTWESPNVVDGEDSGFNAYPAGWRTTYDNVDFLQFFTDAVWWTTTEEGNSGYEGSDDRSWAFGVENEYPDFRKDTWPKETGFSVRCIMN